MPKTVLLSSVALAPPQNDKKNHIAANKKAAALASERKRKLERQRMEVYIKKER